jgi:16S rRNA (guanine966-N2)-methyltransferase
VVLDLFAGTGALGLEAFSRGAHSVTFVDNSRLAIDLISKNILTCFAAGASLAASPQSSSESTRNMPDTACWTVIQHDLRKGLPLKIFSKKNLSCFDLVFLDPPYSQGLCQQVLQDWDANNLLSASGLLIAEERANEKLETRFSTLDLIDNRVYGDTAFWIFARKHSDIHRASTD